MSKLKGHLKELVKWLEESEVIPEHDGTLFVYRENVSVPIPENDVGDIRIPIHKESICDLEYFESKYESLLNSGFSWLNFQCAGIFDRNLIFVIESPRESVGAKHTSVNYSGPFNAEDGTGVEWNFEKKFRLF